MWILISAEIGKSQQLLKMSPPKKSYSLRNYVPRLPDNMCLQATNLDIADDNLRQVHITITVIVGLYPHYVTSTGNQKKGIETIINSLQVYCKVLEDNSIAS